MPTSPEHARLVEGWIAERMRARAERERRLQEVIASLYDRVERTPEQVAELQARLARLQAESVRT